MIRLVLLKRGEEEKEVWWKIQKKRVVINKDVCEGCGDCSVQSNCVSIEPLETELGRKRKINQSNCNKDYSCIKGFCPSFITVDAEIKNNAEFKDLGELPELW